MSAICEIKNNTVQGHRENTKQPRAMIESCVRV